MAKIRRHALDQSPFYGLRSRKKLAEVLGFDRRKLEALARAPLQYKERDIETKKGKIRHTEEPRGPLRQIHERAKRLLSRIEPPDFLFCPVKGRSYVDNAIEHVNARDVRTVDVKNYFASTPRHRVYWFFHSIMNCESDVAAVLAHLLTANGHVPTGSPVSPILSFFAFFDMWHSIALQARNEGCKVTVYMDDLTVSGATVSEGLMWSIKKTIHKTGLRYHKERRFSGGRAEVTGVVIRNGSVVLPNRQRKRAFDLRTTLRTMNEGEEKDRLARTLAGLDAQKRQVEVT
ncbi:MAG TPA: reverse transcriptase family protein [Magnetospirillaceae bacterium]|jgi:hypothetical protein